MMMMKRAEKRSVSERIRLAEAMLSSGQTQKAWCEEHGVRLGTLRDWVRLWRQTNEPRPPSEEVSARKWLEVNAQGLSPAPEVALSPEIAIRIGVCTVHVVAGFDREALADVCGTLLSLC